MPISLATDVHQHLWPPEFLGALSARRSAPSVHGRGDELTVHVPGEPDSPFGLEAHDPMLRVRSLRDAGLDRALLCMSSPLGVEALPEAQSRPLLQAWHDGVFVLGDRFGVWGAIPIDGYVEQDVDELLDRGAVGVSVPAAAISGPGALERLGPVLRRLELRGAPLLIHPGPATAEQFWVSGETGESPPWWPAMTRYVADMQAAWLTFARWGRESHPLLRVCFAMLAGGAPFHVERLIARGGPAEAVHDPGIFYDISSYGPKAIAAVAAIVGSEQLVHGSDTPVVAARRPSTALGRSAAVAMIRDNVYRLVKGAPR
jgi:predicted TIM-barrel fold metal-dependent hydrolase